ncbi:MAG: hypothetical protein IJK46_03690 [Prevotella sp.]|nr:hypothetical protein [Prevotella sp.]
MKKKYIVPETKKLVYKTESLLYTVSVWYGGEGNDQPIDAKESLFEEESDCVYDLPSIKLDMWAEGNDEE